MEKVIKLLNSEKQHLTNRISSYIDSIETAKAAIKDLQSPEFIERNKDRECWSEDWTIQDYIELNVNSNNRSIETYSKRLTEKKDYLSQIERALKILKEANYALEPLCMNCKLFYATPKCKYATRPDQYADECHAYKPIETEI